MKNVLTTVSAALWIAVLACSLRPWWRRREWKYLWLPALLAVTAAANGVKLFTAEPQMETTISDTADLFMDVLAVAAVCIYSFYVNRLASAREQYEELAAKEQQARQEADTERQRAADVLERVSDSFFSLDNEFRFAFVSREALRVLQKKPEELLGQTVFAVFPGSEYSPFGDAYREAIAKQHPIFVEACYEPWDRWFENRVYPSREGVSVFFHDITERKKIEAQLQSAKIQLDVAIAASNIGVWDWDIEHSRVSYSPEWKAQLGYKPEEIEDSFQSWESRVHPEDYPVVMERMQRYLENSTAEYETEFRLRHRDGTYRWILTRGELERDAAGKPKRMRGCHIDITERKRDEEALRASQRELRALAAHLESVREHEGTRISRELHDQLGQALTALKLDLKWLAERLPKPAEGENDPLGLRLNQAISLTDETIKNVRRICLELRPALLDQLGLPTAIEWQAREFETRTGVPCDVSVSQELAHLTPETATALFRISQEALTNVAKHANASQVHIVLEKRAGMAHLCVSDDGRGLPLQPDRSAKGFGMLGMRERAIAAGGEIQIESAPGRGVSLCVDIPLDPPEENDLFSSQHSHKITAAGESIAAPPLAVNNN